MNCANGHGPYTVHVEIGPDGKPRYITVCAVCGTPA